VGSKKIMSIAMMPGSALLIEPLPPADQAPASHPSSPRSKDSRHHHHHHHRHHHHQAPANVSGAQGGGSDSGGPRARTRATMQAYVDPGIRHVPEFIITFVLKVRSGMHARSLSYLSALW
jgi:hypothetical protein